MKKYLSLFLCVAVLMFVLFVFAYKPSYDTPVDDISSKEKITSKERNEENSHSQDFGEGVETSEEITIPETLDTKEEVITVEKGDSFIGILTKKGLDYNEATSIYQAYKKVYDARTAKVGQIFYISWLNYGRTILKITTEPVSGTRYIVERLKNGSYTARIEQGELKNEIKVVSGIINGTVVGSMKLAGVPQNVAGNFVNIFSYSVDFRRDAKIGDKFDVAYTRKMSPDGKVVKTGDIVYAALTLGKVKTELYRFEDGGFVDYYNEKGLALKKNLDRKPLELKKARISSKFSLQNPAVLYEAPIGTKVYASADGTVTEAKWINDYGNYIAIQHSSEYSTGYGHLKSYAKGIRPGVRVKQGQVIAYVGSTDSSSSGLLFEVIKNGQKVDPLKVRAATGDNLTGEKLKEFEETVSEIKAFINENKPIQNPLIYNSTRIYKNFTEIDSNDNFNNEIELIEDSITLVDDTKEFFFIYKGSDITKEKLDTVIQAIRRDIGYGSGFSIYDNKTASELAYMNWVSMASSNSFDQNFHNQLKYCYNFRQEHSLVDVDSSNFIIFSNYELNKTYQQNRRSGIYKYCKPEEFVKQHIQKVRSVDNKRKEKRMRLHQISSNYQLKQECLDIIRKKFRYVNDLSFNDNIHIEQKNDIYTFSGILHVEATNGVKVRSEYKCIYNDTKKQFVDWSVDNDQLE